MGIRKYAAIRSTTVSVTRSGMKRPSFQTSPGVLDPRRVCPRRHDRVYRVHQIAWVRGRVGGLRQASVVRGHQPLHVLAQVVPQVPPVGDPHRAGRTVTSAVGVAAGPVTADHLHTGVRA